MNVVQVYVSLGGNFPETPQLFKAALLAIKKDLALDNVIHVSACYRTTPVSSISQPDFFNAACTFSWRSTPHDLLSHLQVIEKKLGKIPKHREAPRPIDLDLIFFGEQTIQSEDLIVPHPRWQERLFVVQPLLDLVPLDYLADLAQRLAKESDYKVEICHDTTSLISDSR